MAVSEAKMKIVIDNYFKTNCDVNTSIRGAFEKGFRVGVEKGMEIKTKSKTNSASFDSLCCVNTFEEQYNKAREHCIEVYRCGHLEDAPIPEDIIQHTINTIVCKCPMCQDWKSSLERLKKEMEKRINHDQNS